MVREKVNPHATSSYAKYAKSPHLYSPTLQKLIAARLRGDHAEADELGFKHSAENKLRQWLKITSIVNTEE